MKISSLSRWWKPEFRCAIAHGLPAYLSNHRPRNLTLELHQMKMLQNLKRSLVFVVLKPNYIIVKVWKYFFYSSASLWCCCCCWL